MGSIVSIVLALLSGSLAAVSTYHTVTVRRRLEFCERRLANAQNEIKQFKSAQREQLSLRRQLRVTKVEKRTAVRAKAPWRALPRSSPARVVAERLLSRGERPEVVSQKVLLPVTEIIQLREVIFPPIPELVSTAVSESKAAPSNAPAVFNLAPISKLSVAEPLFVRELALL